MEFVNGLEDLYPVLRLFQGVAVPAHRRPCLSVAEIRDPPIPLDFYWEKRLEQQRSLRLKLLVLPSLSYHLGLLAGSKAALSD